MADVRRSESGSSSIDNGQLPRHETSTMSDERTPLLRRRVTPPVHTLGSSRSQTTTATPAASSRGSRVSSWIAKHAPQPGNWKLVLVWVAGLGAVGAIAALWIVSRSSSIILQLLSSLGSLSTCSTCFSLLLPARQLALLGDAAFTNTFTNLCIDLQIQPAYICKGAVGRQAPVIAQSLRRIQPNKRTAALLCSQLFGLCSIRGESIPDWGEEVFPVRNVTRQPATRTGKLRKIVHISDIHLDRKYKVGSEAVCGEVLCCRNTSSSLTSTGKPHWPAGPFGNPHCDTPFSLFRAMLDEITRVAGDAAFAISTGDVPSHGVWEDTQESTTRDVLDVYAIMRSVLPMPVVGAIGNHDIAPVNLFPRSNDLDAFRQSQWVYDLHYNAWRDSISSQVSRSDFLENVGSFAYDLPKDRLRVISINTNYWNPENFYLFDTDYPADDPEGVFAFMIRTLHEAETKGMHAILIGHSPPAYLFPKESHYFDQIVQRFRSTIVGQYYGHTHSSDYHVAYSTPAHKSRDTASSVSFVAGALTPFEGLVNPGFRVYEIDEGTGELWDLKEYYLNITDPELKHGPRWQLLYSAREMYSPHVPDSDGKPLDPAFWHSLSLALGRSETLFRQFIFNKFRGSRWGATKACRSQRCHNRVVCGLRRSRSEERCSNDPSEPVEPNEPERGDVAALNRSTFGMQALLRDLADKAKKGHIQPTSQDRPQQHILHKFRKHRLLRSPEINYTEITHP